MTFKKAMKKFSFLNNEKNSAVIGYYLFELCQVLGKKDVLGFGLTSKSQWD